jgi:peroxiredoxin
MTATSRPVAIREAFERYRDMDASLSERLAGFASTVRALNPSFHAAADRLVDRLTRSGSFKGAPGIGDAMPAFLLPDYRGRLVGLDALLSAGPAAITFHRGHWCPYCRISIRTWARAYDQVRRLGSEVVAVTPDLQQFAAQFQTESQADFPILSDVDNGYALSLGLAVWVGAEMQALMRDLGQDLEKFQGNDLWAFPIPATFVVGTDGRIVARFLDPDYRKRAAIELVLEALATTR